MVTVSVLTVLYKKGKIMIKRITPKEIYNGLPCSLVSVGCAVGEKDGKLIEKSKGLKEDGYLTLDNMNRYIRSMLPIQKKEYFKRGERPLLKDFLEGNTRKAVVCLLGHYIYVEGEQYWSFFKNEMDPVVCVWWIKE